MRGFSLIEIILSIAALTLLAGITLPYGLASATRADLDGAVIALASALGRAEDNASAGLRDSMWGVWIDADEITLFQGPSFAERVQSADEVSPLPASVSPSKSSESVFSKVTGDPLASAEITLNTTSNETRTITLSSHGTISY